MHAATPHAPWYADEYISSIISAQEKHQATTGPGQQQEERAGEGQGQRTLVVAPTPCSCLSPRRALYDPRVRLISGILAQKSLEWGAARPAQAAGPGGRMLLQRGWGMGPLSSPAP